ncbi:Uncharacterised protein [Vibrio cholerae]|nr:Uncharacterised protein [Vibrio cholerae]
MVPEYSRACTGIIGALIAGKWMRADINMPGLRR